MKDTTPRGNIRNDTHSNTVSNVFRILDTEYPQNAGRKTLSVFLLQPLRELGETLASVFPSYCNGLRVRMRLAFWRERTFRILEPHENLPTMQVGNWVLCSHGKELHRRRFVAYPDLSISSKHAGEDHRASGPRCRPRDLKGQVVGIDD
ncbi:unnamed protein product [Fusarium graminearum]|uniref:Chromosome 2, complete genome n=1 Tax=Gibberella zeae (strain ATCC MYA-4620 / CBS 123657 / FGSC 9075 / NRRL 31084 / PH-1) TaxID=229533 RepID=A0A098DGE4_GIBZE|nr:unnamed protein product [Fusarium graminearum]